MMSSGTAPAVSIVTATYNWSSVLRCAIESVRMQTFADFELLVAGDGCTDDSEAVVRAFEDPRLRWMNLPANSGGQAAPNNCGIAAARGEYIAYLGHDDVWYPTHLESLVETIRRTSADLALRARPHYSRAAAKITGVIYLNMRIEGLAALSRRFERLRLNPESCPARSMMY
jgi:glycosyltransferase involved in cell wall biosynthesis